jgi:hypothetical protein
VENSAHALLSVWETYYVILGSSAAALTGLQFVVIALVADTPGLGSEDSVSAFGTPTIVHFCLCLFVAAILSAPWSSLIPVTWLLLAAGSIGVFYSLIVFRRARRQTTYRPVAEDWLWHVAFPLIAYGALIAAAVFLGQDPASALFLVGAVALTLIFIGIHNAWDSVAYVAVQHRSKQRE